MTNTVNQLATVGNLLSMTSKEIADLTGKRHGDVLRDIRNTYITVFGDGAELRHEADQHVTFETDERGYMALARLGKDFTLTLLTGYDATARFKVIRRWQELEAGALPDFSDPVAAARAWANAEEARRTAEAAKAALERDNGLLNTIIDNEFGHCSILRAAQHLGIHESAFKWQTLKRATLEAGLEVKRVPSPRFDYQNLYPITAFQTCYPQYDFSGLQPEAVATRAVKLLGGQVMTTAH